MSACPDLTVSAVRPHRKRCQRADFARATSPHFRSLIEAEILDLVISEDRRRSSDVIAARHHVQPGPVEQVKDRLLLQGRREAATAKMFLRSAAEMAARRSVSPHAIRNFILSGLDIVRECGEAVWSDLEAA